MRAQHSIDSNTCSEMLDVSLTVIYHSSLCENSASTYLECLRMAGDCACTVPRARPRLDTCRRQHNAPCRFSRIAAPTGSNRLATCRVAPRATVRRFLFVCRSDVTHTHTLRDELAYRFVESIRATMVSMGNEQTNKQTGRTRTMHESVACIIRQKRAAEGKTYSLVELSRQLNCVSVLRI